MGVGGVSSRTIRKFISFATFVRSEDDEILLLLRRSHTTDDAARRAIICQPTTKCAGNVMVIHAQPMQQLLPRRDMPQIHHPPRNVTSIWIKLWLLFLSLWVFLQAIHVRQIQREYAVPQFAHPPPNVPLIFDHPPAIQPWQQPLPRRNVQQFDHPLPHGLPNHPNPPRVLEVIRRLGEWRGRQRDPRRPLNE
ncbi:hypothetical protein niasHT_005848 [Heterodera trifolii]|uniref:Uncharacterized protein n=1 Tax=Heterodera trifolii TaxID=157864 RepID=A0ABD2MCI7_9BILA